jgi:hypothetical protein
LPAVTAPSKSKVNFRYVMRSDIDDYTLQMSELKDMYISVHFCTHPRRTWAYRGLPGCAESRRFWQGDGAAMDPYIPITKVEKSSVAGTRRVRAKCLPWN